MTAAVPTFSQIKAQVAAIRQKLPDARLIGIRASGRWTGESPRRDGEHSYVIRQCDSPLAMRMALREPVEAETTLVLITNLDDTQLSDDILLRLPKQKLFQIKPWEIVRSLFQAHAVDRRLTRHGWIAQALLEEIPTEGYPPARAGFLDAERVWPLLLRKEIGLMAESPDLAALLKWSLDGEGNSRFRMASDEFRLGTIEWLSEKAGPVAAAVLHCIEKLDGPDAVALGLAAGVVFHPAAIGQLERATGKLEERFLGGKSQPPALMQRWSAAAAEVVRALRHTDSRIFWQTLQRGDEILKDVQADALAHLSDNSPLGFDQRLARFGRELLGALRLEPRPSGSGVSQGQVAALEPLTAARDAVRAHDQANQEGRRLERIEMSVRLVRWLERIRTAPKSPPLSLAEAAEDYLAEGSFVDWARLCLRSDDPVRELSAGYTRLFGEVTRIREDQSAHFARLLADWTSAGSVGDEIVPVERILERVVAPLAAQQPVLVIVIDGMSGAVCRELLADVTKHEWTLLAEEGRGTMRPGLAAIPSKTEASRTSLLCGVLRQGAAADEKAGFAQHSALLAHCRSGSPPVLFHKLSLRESSEGLLAPEVRKEIESSHRRVVGVVVNAVDDHLEKGEQIDTRWSRDEIRVLPTLLHEARLASRLVILVSDHGHILDCQAEGRPQTAAEPDGGERWRPDDGAVKTGELVIAGSRVILPASRRLIVPWSEKVRYGMKKNGYHGGASPQEMVVPIAVLCATGDDPVGWTEARVAIPSWWDEAAPPILTSQPEPRLKPAKPKPSGRLFDLDDDQATPAAEVSGKTAVAAALALPDWVARLLASEVFKDQKKLGGRTIPADEVFGRILAALDSRGGKMTSATLARTLECPPMRLRSMLAIVRRVLNVDGYGVLTKDDASDT
ncbi:MAG: BREX-2 system phosphatase PglZ, partial [Planctomycetaceae bacterium]|nr:BREX-2 system phosphatase PglZ [Planctomycetaceae bacterium]